MGRTLVIGDVHGCLDELDSLLEEAELTADDSVVHVGDLVAKGPDSRGVVARMRELGARGVRGNHEEHVFRVRDARRRGDKPRATEDHIAVAKSLKDAEWEYLEALPYSLDLPEHGAIVVHAGLDPTRRFEEQSPDVLTTVRSVLPDGSTSKRLTTGVPWASLYEGPAEILFGHDAVRGLQKHPHAMGLDTGCVYGNRLTALVLPERRIISVSAREVWRKARGPARFEVGPADAFDDKTVKVVRIEKDAKGRPREAIVLRDDRGVLRAYVNRCKHLPIPLDGGGREFLDRTGRFVMCGTHSALYRRHDGFCFEGPCEGESLDSIGLAVEGGVVFVLDERR